MTSTAAIRRTLIAWTLLTALVGVGPLVAGNEYILRAPAAEAAEIAYRNGLTIVEEIAVAGDPVAHGLYRVQAPDGTTPAAVVALVEELEPAVLGIEPVTVARLPELDQSTRAILDQSTIAILDSLMTTRALTPPVGKAGPGLLGEPSERRIKGFKLKDGKIDEYETEKLVLHLQWDENRRRDDVTLRADFAPGCSVEYDPDFVPPPIQPSPALDIDGRKVIWEIANNSETPLTVNRVDVSWPAANLGLKKVKLRSEVKQTFEPPSVSVDFAELEDPEDRRIDPGKTEKLELEFISDAGLDQADYRIEVFFAEGPSLVSAPCAVAAENEPRYDRNKLEWILINLGGSDTVLESVTVGWPPENGLITEVHFSGRPVFRSETEFGKVFDGKDTYDRMVWTGYVDQASTSILRVREAQGAHKGYATVAVIDTGVDPDHWLLAPALVPGYDFLRDEPGFASEFDGALDPAVAAMLKGSGRMPLEEEQPVELNQSVIAILDADKAADLAGVVVPPALGHGTMVASVIHRVAPYASIMPLRVFDGDGHADLLDIVEAIYYAVDHGANVINMSFNVDTYSPELMRAINYAARNGVASVASAGNHGQEKIVYPAAFGNTLGIASSGLADQVSDFSNLGNDLVTVAAPGEGIVVAYPGGGWAVASGTSFAAPWVSGAAAIFADKNGREHQPGRSDFYLASEALSHAAPIQGHGAGRAGHGRADLKEAVDKLKDGAALGTTGVAEVPYVISAEFAQGCSVAYPPAAYGSGCAAEVSGQLELDGDKIGLMITNAGLETIDVARIEVSWPAVHEELKKVKLDGDSIFETELPPTSAVIDSGWKDPDKPEKRQIEPGATVELRFEFEEDLD